jgi:aminoglycoside 3-N-acetyltransferase
MTASSPPAAAAPAGAALVDRLLAIGETAGRSVVERYPDLRRRLGRRVRKPPAEQGELDLAELRAALLGLGLERGRDLLVHSSWISLRKLSGRLAEVIALLRELIGPDATLLMPTHPRLGERDGLPVYDVARSPSTVGLLSERLRREPGALRSPFPLAPVCALGPDASLYTGDFREESGRRPYGHGSPYQRLGARRGQVVFLGIDFIRCNTLEHCAFDLLRDENPVADYYAEKSFLVLRDGREERWDVLQPRKELEKFLATFAFRRMSLRSGAIRCARPRGHVVQWLDAARFLDWHLPLARAGWPYWGAPTR